MVMCFLIGSLLGALLFIKFYLMDVVISVMPEIPEITLPELPPTWSQSAYDAYINGIDYGLDGDHELSIEQHMVAVQEDPGFSLAWAALSRAHSAMFFAGTDPTDERLIMARDAVDRAFQLDANLPEAHLALAYFFYQGTHDYQRALEQLAIAEPHFPNNTNLLKIRAYIYRSIGEWNAAIYEFERASDIESQNLELIQDQAFTHLMRRDYFLAESFFDRVLGQDPNHEVAQIQKAMIQLHQEGNPASLASLAQSALGSGRPWMGWLAAFIQRDYLAAREVLDETVSNTLIWNKGYMPKTFAYGLTHHLDGNFEIAQHYFQDAREVLELDLETDPDNADLLIALGEVLAYEGAHQSAALLANRVMELPIVANNQFVSPYYRISAARVLTAAGEYDAAINELETYLSFPGRYSIDGISADPRFEVLLTNIRFQTLVNRYKR